MPLDILGTLLRPSRSHAYIGAESVSILQIDPSTLDAAATPGALYVLIKQGGFVTWSANTVQALQARGFSIQSHDVSADERAWMDARTKGYGEAGRPGLVWFAACPMGATVDAEGLPMCGSSIPGFLEVAARPGVNPCSVDSIPEELEGTIKPGAIEAVKRIAPNGATVCPRYFGGNPTVTGSNRASAQRTVAIYDSLTKKVAGVESQRLRSGRAYGAGQATAVANARMWLANVSQPVEVFRSSFAGSGNRGSRARRARLGFEPISTATAIVYSLICIAVIVASVSAAVSFLSDDKVQMAGIEAHRVLNEALGPTIKDLSACVADTSRTDAQRAACAESLKSLAPELGVDPDVGPTDWGKVAMYGTIGVGVVAAVYLVGPAIRAASTSTAAALQVGEQKNVQRRKRLEEIGGRNRQRIRVIGP